VWLSLELEAGGGGSIVRTEFVYFAGHEAVDVYAQAIRYGASVEAGGLRPRRIEVLELRREGRLLEELGELER
jgi:hypothetical protein